jgi:hypothetical protein
MNNNLELGKIITDENAQRDAIHIAVVPLIAGEDLYTSSRVKLAFNSLEVAMNGCYNEEKVIGIVDPFLDNGVKEGQRFWCFLLPNTVTGMRHFWQHPSFDNVEIKTLGDHEKWLREFCDKWNFYYDELIEAGTSKGDWRYVTAHGYDLHSGSELGEDYLLFWEHLEGLTGQEYDYEHREGMGWSCSC